MRRTGAPSIDFRAHFQTLRFLIEQGIKLPIRATSGPTQGEIEWRRPCRVSLQYLLKNPIYAGAYVFGRRPIDPRRKIPGRPGTGHTTVSPEKWKVFLCDRYPAYITWDQHQAILDRIQANRNVCKEAGAPRRGAALLAGLMTCGRCQRRMMVRYRRDASGGYDYVCDRMVSERAEPVCQRVAGHVLDDFIVQQVLKALEPASLDLSLHAAENIERQRTDLDLLWQKRLERVRFEAGRAERHYLRIEPENRLVARELARQWDQKLAAQRSLQEEYDRFQRTQPRILTAEERETIRSLAADIPALWASSATTNSDRKEILRQVLDCIVVEVVGRTEKVRLRIEWAGGTHTEHEVRRNVVRTEDLSYWPQLVERLREMVAQGLVVEQIVETLAAEGWRTSTGADRFRPAHLQLLLKRLGLRLRHRMDFDPSVLAPDEWWMTTLARELGVCRVTIFHWIHDGWVRARRSMDGRWVVHADEETLSRLRIYRGAPHGRHARRRYLQERSVPNPTEEPIAPNGNGVLMPRKMTKASEQAVRSVGTEAESGPRPGPSARSARSSSALRAFPHCA